MSSLLVARLQALQTEYESGQRMLLELEARRTSLTQTLLRLEGAMQLARELLAAAPPLLVDDRRG